MRDKYNGLILGIAQAQERDNLTAGQMLLLAFDSLFNNLDTANADLRAAAAADALDVSPDWASVDVFAAARDLGTVSSRPEMHELLDLTIFMHRILVVKEFFSLCTRSMVVFKAEASQLGQLLPTMDEVARPVKLFLAEYYRRQLLGVGSQSLATLTCRYVEARESNLLTNLKDKMTVEDLSKAFLDTRLSKPGMSDKGRFLSLEFENIWGLTKKTEVAKYLAENVEALQANQNCNGQQRVSFQWYHAESLAASALSGSSVAVVSPSLHETLNDLKSYVAALTLVFDELTAANLEYGDLRAAVESRLKWAAGANPEVREVLDSFSAAFVFIGVRYQNHVANGLRRAERRNEASKRRGEEIIVSRKRMKSEWCRGWDPRWRLAES